ncbi:MAG TPA: serpin family protein [Clostridia bacterium]
MPTIVDQIPADAVMYLVNAIHFKADWAVPFETANTVKGVFHATGKDVEASFMNRSGKMQYLADGGLTGVLLPYVGDRFAFFAILPGEGVTPRDMLGKLDNARLSAFLKTLQANKANSTVDLALPKFETAYKDSLKNELVSMGMDLAFDDARADFSLMNEAHLRNLFIGDVLHKTFCRVDEKGTEAAAVTAVVIKTASMPVPGVQMKLDRPFLYGIVDLQTGVPMFVGILENPVG